MKIGIIGAGPAGIIAAIKTMQQDAANEVFLFDGNQKIGRKLFATGNGRCNITNMNAWKDSYFSRKPADLSPVFDQYPPARLREVFDALGIPTCETDDGWVYPLSYSAANVVQILADDLQSAGVRVFSGCKISGIKPDGDGFKLVSDTDPHNTTVDRLIIAGGSKAFPQLGANTSILSELFPFGHRDIPFSPALAPITAKGDIFRVLQGVRTDAEVTLFDKDEELGKCTGNLIFTDYGLNGPAVMNLSHLISQVRPETFQIRLNFIPGDMKKQIETQFYKHINRDFPYRSVFLAELPYKLVEYYFKLWKLDWETSCKRIDSRTFRIHLKRLESGMIPITGERGFNYGQAAAGGIPLNEVDLQTMGSRLKPGLYFAGEVLDVVGPCGGYNLTWAFATGLIAGENAGK